MSFLKGFSDDFSGHNYGYVPHQIPRSFHRQPGSPSDGDPSLAASGTDFNTTHSPLSHHEDDFDFSGLASQNEHISNDQAFLQAGPSSNAYGPPRGSSSRYPGHSGTMSLPSELAAAQAFAPSYHSLYGHGYGASSSQYSAGLSHMHTLGSALGGVDTQQPLLYAPSPAGSDSSLEDSSGSAYSSHSHSNIINPPASSMSLPSNQETEEYLRRTLEIPAHLPVNLYALPEPTEKKQPPITHMIKLAIWGSKHKRLTLRQIYDEVERRYPSLKDLQDKPWQRSIRHNLSLKAIFVRVERPTSDPGKGHYWALDTRQGEGNKRDRKRKDTSGRGSTSRSEDDEEFSEEVDEDRSSLVMIGGRHGDRRGHQALRIPQESQYPGGPSVYPSSSSAMYQQASHARSAPYPPPLIQGPSQVQQVQQAQPYAAMPMNIPMSNVMMPRNDAMSMGMQGFSLPSNIEHRHMRRNNSDTLPNRSIQTPPPMSFGVHLPPLDPLLAAQPEYSMTSVNPNMLHTHPSSRRPTPEDDENSARGSRRHRAY